MYLVCGPLADLSKTFGGLSTPKSFYLAPDTPSPSFISKPDGAKKILQVYVVQHNLEPWKSAMVRLSPDRSRYSPDNRHLSFMRLVPRHLSESPVVLTAFSRTGFSAAVLSLEGSSTHI